MSEAMGGDEFLGLAIDQDNQEEETEERIIIWVQLLVEEFSPEMAKDLV